jgi:hypothetical protein
MEDFWLEFLRSLVKRGLKVVQLVTSDAHEGLKAAIAQVLTEASWQRAPAAFHAQYSRPCAGWASGDDSGRAAHHLCPAPPGSGQAAAVGGV